MIKPLVSIIVPLFNYEKYISNCIKSIMNQDYDNYEIIIVDDCSTDNSYKIAKGFTNENIRAIKLKSNLGYSNAKNEGIISSKGRFVAILDADDLFTKNSVSVRVETLLKNNLRFVHADAISVYGNISLKKCYKIKESKLEFYTRKMHMKKKNMILRFSTPYAIHAQTVMVDRDLYKEFGLYDIRLKSRSDREMWWRFFGQSEKDEIKVERCYVKKAVAYYRYHKKSMTKKRQKNTVFDVEVRDLSEKIYFQREKEGITVDNTLFLKK